MRKTIVLLVAICLTACKAPTIITESRTVTITDSVRDTTVVTQPDSATMRALLMCDSLGNVLLLDVERLNGQLNAKVGGVNLTPAVSVDFDDRYKLFALDALFFADSLIYVIELRDRYIKELLERTPPPVEVYKPPNGFQRMLQFSGIIFWIVVLALIVIGTLKNRF